MNSFPLFAHAYRPSCGNRSTMNKQGGDHGREES